MPNATRDDPPPQSPPVIPYRSPPDPAAEPWPTPGRPRDGQPFVAGCGLTLLLTVATVVVAPVAGSGTGAGAIGGIWALLAVMAVGRGVAQGRWGFARGVAVGLTMVVVPLVLLLVFVLLVRP